MKSVPLSCDRKEAKQLLDLSSQPEEDGIEEKEDNVTVAATQGVTQMKVLTRKP